MQSVCCYMVWLGGLVGRTTASSCVCAFVCFFHIHFHVVSFSLYFFNSRFNRGGHFIHSLCYLLPGLLRFTRPSHTTTLRWKENCFLNPTSLQNDLFFFPFSLHDAPTSLYSGHGLLIWLFMGGDLVADHREHAVSLRWVHDHKHVLRIKCELPAVFVNTD